MCVRRSGPGAGCARSSVGAVSPGGGRATPVGEVAARSGSHWRAARTTCSARPRLRGEGNRSIRRAVAIHGSTQRRGRRRSVVGLRPGPGERFTTPHLRGSAGGAFDIFAPDNGRAAVVRRERRVPRCPAVATAGKETRLPAGPGSAVAPWDLVRRAVVHGRWRPPCEARPESGNPAAPGPMVYRGRCLTIARAGGVQLNGRAPTLAAHSSGRRAAGQGYRIARGSCGFESRRVSCSFGVERTGRAGSMRRFRTDSSVRHDRGP